MAEIASHMSPDADGPMPLYVREPDVTVAPR
jgi:hypothetical protein